MFEAFWSVFTPRAPSAEIVWSPILSVFPDKYKSLNLFVLFNRISFSLFTLSEAIDLATSLEIPEVYLTHISHQLGTHTAVSNELPANIMLAYDGLQISL